MLFNRPSHLGACSPHPGYAEKAPEISLHAVPSCSETALCACRGNAGESIDPTAFNGSFKAQLAVQRVSDCTPAPLINIQGIVNFYRPGRFQQHLAAQQVAALSLLLSLKPLRPSLTAPQSKVQPAKPSMAALAKASVAEQPSASCKVTQPGLAKAGLESSTAAVLKAKAALERSTAAVLKAAASRNAQSAALDKAPRTGAAVSNTTAVAPARDESGTSRPFAFQMNGLKGKAGSAVGAGQHKRRVSLAAVLDDVFEEVLSTPRSHKKRRRIPAAQLAEPPEQPVQPIDLTVSPAKEQQAAAHPAHAPMSPIDLTGSGAEAAPAPAEPARKRVRKWDQMPASMQNSAAAVQQEAAKAPPEPVSSAPLPVVGLKAAKKLPAQPASGPKPHEDAPQQQGAPTSQALEPSKALQASASAGTAPEASELPAQASARNKAAQVQEEGILDLDQANRSLPVTASAVNAPEGIELPVQTSAADQAGHVQKSASVNPEPESKLLPAKAVVATAPAAPGLSVQASAPDQAAQVQNSASPDPDPASAAVKPLVPGCALICACSAQEADESFNRHQLPLPQKLREAHPKAVIRQGLRVFLHNADTRRLLGPFYARQAKGSDEKVPLLI